MSDDHDVLFSPISSKNSLGIPVDFPFRNVLVTILTWEPLLTLAQLKTEFYHAGR